MKCDRCYCDLNFIYENTVHAEVTLNIKEYYCPRM